MSYFDNVEHQNKLRVILKEWEGTPFRHHCGVKGLGCDCIHFVGRVIEELGLIHINDRTIDNYPPDWHLHNTRERLSEAIESKLNVDKISLAELKNGDIVLFHYGKAASHAALFMDGYLYQALIHVGVVKLHYTDPVMQRQMRFAYRIR